MKTFCILLSICLSYCISSAQVTSFAIDNSKLDVVLSSQLDSIYKLDQSVRIAYNQSKTQDELPSVTDSLLMVMRKADHENLIKVNAIIKKHGWLGPQKVGFNGAQGLFLVIQHADLETQEHYLPIIKEAEKKGEILSSNVAILDDRISIRKGKHQLYGSQGFTDNQTGKKYIYPILDVDNLDIRRKAMGMPPMREYVLGWDAEHYKKELPALEILVKHKRLNDQIADGWNGIKKF
ncbi:MAG: hypothetical protein EOO92_00540 [Pedobacter sp.]|nr:MAG: hypothetical protein EOO92_00540 [Pedobacter sp.]